MVICLSKIHYCCMHVLKKSSTVQWSGSPCGLSKFAAYKSTTRFFSPFYFLLIWNSFFLFLFFFSGFARNLKEKKKEFYYLFIWVFQKFNISYSFLYLTRNYKSNRFLEKLRIHSVAKLLPLLYAIARIQDRLPNKFFTY